jgi:hypothetical protein
VEQAIAMREPTGEVAARQYTHESRDGRKTEQNTADCNQD